MKKLLLLSIVLIATPGCGGGWLPLYRGASCHTCAEPALPAAPACSDCGTSAGYTPAYDGMAFGENVVGGPYYSDAAPAMSSLPAPGN